MENSREGHRDNIEGRQQMSRNNSVKPLYQYAPPKNSIGQQYQTSDGGRQPSESSRYNYIEEPVDDEGANNNLDADDNYDSHKVWACDAFRYNSRRAAFARKVFAIVALELAVCAGWTAACIFVKPLNNFVSQHWYLGVGAGFLLLAIHMAVGCCNVGRGKTSCLNVTILFIFTILMSYFTGYLAIRYQLAVVILSLGLTVAVLFILILITACTKIDVTGWLIYVFAASLILFLFTIVCVVLYTLGVINQETYMIIKLVVSLIFAILCCYYILWDLQAILGGRRTQLEEEDWLYACISLFGDITRLFQSLLTVVNSFMR